MERECTAFCSRKGLIVDRVFREEGESAKTINRTQLQEMLRYLAGTSSKREITTVVVYRVDRLAREVGGHHTIKASLAKIKVRLVSVLEHFDDSPTGKLTENLMAVLAQFDNDLRSQRTTDGMKAALLHGRWVWRPPFGYQRGPKEGKSLEIDPVLGPVVKRAFEAVARGEHKEPVRLELAQLGVRTSSGRPISPHAFNLMLVNPLYVGRVVVPSWDIDIEGDFKALIEPSVFHAASLATASGGAHADRRHLDSVDFPLRRIVRCGACDLGLTASWSTGKSGKRYPYYHCRNRQCRATTVRRELLDEAFLAWLGDLNVPEALLDLMDAVTRDLWNEVHTRGESRRESVLKSLGELETRQDRLVDAYLDNSGIDEVTFRRHCDKFESEKTALREELSVANVTGVELPQLLACARALLVDVPKSWNTLEPLQRQPFLRALVPAGLTYANGVVGTPETPWCVRGITDLTAPVAGLAALMAFFSHPTPEFLKLVKIIDLNRENDKN